MRTFLEMLNTPMAVLVMLVVAVSVNSFLYFNYYLPRTATAAAASSPLIERTEPAPNFEKTQRTEESTVKRTPPKTTPESSERTRTERTRPIEATATSTATSTATASSRP